MKKFFIMMVLLASPGMALACGGDGKQDFRTDQQKFADWDKNGDESIDYDEFYRRVPVNGIVARQKDWKERMKADENKNGKIEIKEFQRAMPFVNC